MSTRHLTSELHYILGSGLITNSVSDDRSGIWPWKHGMAVKTDLAVKTDHKQAILTFYAKVIFFAFLAQGLQLVVQFWPFWTMGWAMCPDASRSWFEKQWYVCVCPAHTHVCIVIYLYLVIYVNIYNCWFVWLQLSKKKHTNIMIQFTYTTHIAHVKKCSTWRRNNKKLVGWRVDGNIYVDEPNFIFSSGEVRRPHMLLGRSKIANRKSPIRPFTTKKKQTPKKKQQLPPFHFLSWSARSLAMSGVANWKVCRRCCFVLLIWSRFGINIHLLEM